MHEIDLKTRLQLTFENLIRRKVLNTIFQEQQHSKAWGDFGDLLARLFSLRRAVLRLYSTLLG